MTNETTIETLAEDLANKVEGLIDAGTDGGEIFRFVQDAVTKDPLILTTAAFSRMANGRFGKIADQFHEFCHSVILAKREKETT